MFILIDNLSTTILSNYSFKKESLSLSMLILKESKEYQLPSVLKFCQHSITQKEANKFWEPVTLLNKF